MHFAPSASAQLADSDLDGLDDAYEISIGTLPNNPDTDGDGFNDGIEVANTGIGNPLTSDSPEFGNVLYDFTNVQESVTQNDSLHRLMPVFNPVDGLSFAYIVAASPGYTNPRIAVATVGDPNSETFITDPGDLPSPFNFHQLTYKSDGSAVLFDNGKDIFAVSTFGGGVAQLTVMDATSFVYNPEVVRIDGVDWIVAGGRDSASTALVAWQHGTTPTGGIDVIGLVDLPSGDENYPRVSANGNEFIFHNRLTVAPNYAGLDIATGFTDIIKGNAPIITSGVATPHSGNITHFPGGVGLSGNFAVWSYDTNLAYVLGIPGDFSSSNFQIVLFAIAGGQSARIPFIGNQPFCSLDKNGTKLILCSDFNPFLPGKSEFSLLDMSLGVNVKLNDGAVTGPVSVVDPSGVNLSITDGDSVDFPASEPNRIKVSTPRIQSTSEVVNIRTFEPSGTTFTPGGSGPGGIRLTYTYRDEDILGLDEGSLQIARYDPVSATTELLDTTVDAVNNTLEAYITHFSSFAIKGIGPSSVENWALQE